MTQQFRSAAAAVAALLVLGACAATPTAAPQTSQTGAGDTGTEADLEASPERSTSSEPPSAAPPAESADGPLAFTATSLSGAQIDVSSYAGEPVVLWFWAPWCSICRAEAPHLADVVADLGDDVTFLGVPGLGEEAAMQAFVESTGTEGFEHLVDGDGALWQRFGVVSQPAYAFVSPDGTVEVFTGALGPDDLRSRTTSLLDG